MSGGVDPRRLADAYEPNFGVDWVPVLPREQLAQMSEPDLVAYAKNRKAVEEWAVRNKTGSGWVLPAWRKVMANWRKYKIHIILGGNRSGKTELASRLCVWALGTIPEAEVRAYDVNDDYSKQRQQAYIYDALPHGLKNLPTKRGANHAISYRQGQGFTNGQLMLPPLQGWQKGGMLNFVHYSQYENDPKTAEGWRAHLVWADEECPAGLFDTLPYRLVDYHGRLVLSFTTVDGWTDLVQRILGKVRTLEWRYSDLVKRKLPVFQESLTYESTAIYYFWTSDNVFVDTEEMRKTLAGQPEDVVLARAHGIPTKAATAVFRSFSREYAPIGNVIKHAELPFIKNPDYAVTRYMAVDPAGAKNFFCVWVAVDASGTWFIYREWPDASTYGAWSLPAPTVQGKAGPAQRTLGFGIKDYVDMFRQLEGGEEIFERIIDPRMGAAEKQSADEGATTIISDFDKHDLTFIPAPGVDIENGLQLIQGLLAWNSEKDRDSINCPKLFISDQCENIIQAFVDYTAKGGPQEACKDCIDPIRYLAVSDIRYIAPEDMEGRGTSGSY